MTTETTTTEPTILDLTTCVQVRFHKTGLIRRANVDEIQTSAEKKSLRLAKEIAKSDAFEAMMAIKRDLLRWLKKRELPSPFAESVHLIPATLSDEVDAQIANAEAAYGRYADVFVGEYPGLIAQAETDLQQQFDRRNYFTDMSALRSRFYVEKRFFDFSPPSKAKVGNRIAERELSNQVSEIQTMALKCKAALRTGMRDLVSHLVERLTPKADGSRKQFAPTTVEKVVEFLGLFSARNVTRDTQLAALANTATEILQGRDVATLRENEEEAAFVAEKMGTVKAELDKLVEEMPLRAIELDDED